MTLVTGVVAGAGALASVTCGWWLRGGQYRQAGDQLRLSLRWAWLVSGAAIGLSLLFARGGGGLLVARVVYAVGGCALVWIDLDVHRIPDRVLKVVGAAAVGAVLGAAGAERSWGLLRGAVAGAVGLGALYLGLAIVGSMGLGDVKLAVLTGLVLGAHGLSSVVVATVTAFGAAGAAGAVLLVRGQNRNSHVAFGPAVIAGALTALIIST